MTLQEVDQGRRFMEVLKGMRRVGISSLRGVGASLTLVTAFVVPANRRHGTSPFVVAPVAFFAAMFATVVLVYGTGAKSLAALFGTAAPATALMATASRGSWETPRRSRSRSRRVSVPARWSPRFRRRRDGARCAVVGSAGIIGPS
ncbi:MAG: hypothetical protein Q8K79_02175 [Solirubrobacteraceae bacterium]|nr:hypothetical protein [Solirubrobacteraceae bacterium]